MLDSKNWTGGRADKANCYCAYLGVRLSSDRYGSGETMMALIRITQYQVSCPNCGQSWRQFTNPNKPQIGDRQTRWTCPFCRQSYPGGIKEWVDLSAVEKRRYWLY